MILPGIGEPHIKTYESLVQYRCSTPYFNETIKLTIPPEVMPVARVRFFMYNVIPGVRDRPFATSHITLMKDDGTAIEDGIHQLFVYKVKILELSEL